MKSNEYKKLRVESSRGYYPAASAEAILKIVSQSGPQAYREIENYLDKLPKKSITEDLAEKLLNDLGIKINGDYVIPRR